VESGFEKDSGGKRLVSSRVFEQPDESGEKEGHSHKPALWFRYSTENGRAANAMHAASADDKFRKALGRILRRHANLEARPPARQRRLGKDRRLSVQTRFSALHEPSQQSCIWICISSARQTSSCITRTRKRRGPRPRTTLMGAWRVNRSMAYSLCNRIALALRCCCPRTLDPRLLGEGRMGLRQNSCPRRCKRGLDQLHVERSSKVGIRRFS